MANTVEDEGTARDAGYSPVWYLWDRGHDQTYTHLDEPGWVRLVLWGGGGWAADRDGNTGPLGSAGVPEYARRTYRVRLETGDQLRLRLGGRATVTGGSTSWATAGDADDMRAGRCRSGGYPDGGDGLEQKLVVPAGPPVAPFTYDRPTGSQTVTFRRNGSGGASRVWLTPRDGDERLIIVEPGEAAYVSKFTYTDVAPIPQWGAWVRDLSTNEIVFFAWDDYLRLPVGGVPNNHPGFEATRNPPISMSIGFTNVFDEQFELGPLDDDLRDLGAGRSGWARAVEFHDSGAETLPGSGDLPRVPYPVVSGSPTSGYHWNDGCLAETGGTARGADSRPTAYGPTGSGGGGHGGGHGGNAMAMASGAEWDASTYLLAYGAFHGRAGGRWWNDEHVLHVADDDIEVDRPSWLTGDDPDDVVWPDHRSTGGGPWPYEATPWLFGFGAAWICPELPGGEPGWSIGRIAAGHLAGVSMDLSDILDAAT